MKIDPKKNAYARFLDDDAYTEVKKSKLIYLGCPYASNDYEIMASRYFGVTEVAKALTRAGFVVFSPITHAHPIQQRTGWSFWQHLDLPILSICQLMIVYQLEGWQQSVGLTAEIEFAGSLGIPILYLPTQDALVVGEMLIEYDWKGDLRVKS